MLYKWLYSKDGKRCHMNVEGREDELKAQGWSEYQDCHDLDSSPEDTEALKDEVVEDAPEPVLDFGAEESPPDIEADEDESELPQEEPSTKETRKFDNKIVIRERFLKNCAIGTLRKLYKKAAGKKDARCLTKPELITEILIEEGRSNGDTITTYT